jgi:hypothetical protein
MAAVYVIALTNSPAEFETRITFCSDPHLHGKSREGRYVSSIDDRRRAGAVETVHRSRSFSDGDHPRSPCVPEQSGPRETGPYGEEAGVNLRVFGRVFSCNGAT